jgi:hypothetical protein
MNGNWLDWLAGGGSAAGQAGEQRRSLARALLLMAVGALSSAALVAIGILLFGDFGETEGRILLTVLAIAGYSLLGLAATTALGRAPIWLAPTGLGVSAVGFVLFVALIWTEPAGSLLGRLMGTCSVVAVAIAHAALLLLLTRQAGGTAAAQVRRATLVASSVLTAMLVVILLADWEPPELYGRLLGAVAVLTVLGSLLVPILWKLSAGAAGVAPKGWESGAAEAEAVGGARLDLRYRGRTFIVQAVECEYPERGCAVEAWELARGRRAPVAGLGDLGAPDEPHAALGGAVQRIAAIVDEDERARRSLAEASGAPRRADRVPGAASSGLIDGSRLKAG